ncbi:MAG: hypothetical protein NTY16_08060 [Deltaproteobacteria bacterium]|nr:hypothetical protein [Deltaproteobacteria bacterium]
MKRTLTAVLFILAAISSSGLEFRNTSWQMNRDQVVASEQGCIVSEINVSGQQQIVYKAYVNGYAGNITYVLENDKLLSASYRFKNDHHMEIYNYMNAELLDRYGKPSMQTGKLVVWRLENTEIALAHLPDNTCYVAYWEKNYFAQMSQITKANQ